MSGRLYLLVSLGVVVLAATLFFSLFKPVTEEVPLPPDVEVLRNPFLAAELFLEGRGLKVVHPPRFGPDDPLPPTDAVLLNLSPRDGLTHSALDRLMAWVGAGGHLVVMFEEGNRDQDPLMDLLGIEGYTRDAANLEAAVELYFVGETFSYELHLTTDRRLAVDLENEDILAIGDKKGGVFTVDVTWENGMVSVFSERAMFTNARLGEKDHAAFLHRLVEQNHLKPEVWVVTHEVRATWWQLLWRHARPTLGAFAVVLLLYMWYRMPRLGPVAADPPPARRALMEHVSAAGRFYWRQGQAARLISGTREALMARVRRSRPEWLGAGIDLHARLGDLSGLDPRVIAAAMATDPVTHPEAYLEKIQVMETVRRAL